MFRLVIQSGPSPGQRIDVDTALVVGRENGDVVLEDSEVSRRHARIWPTAAGLAVEDLGSSNGTHVNDVRIEAPTVLEDGATIRLGTTTILVERTTATAASDAGATVLSGLPAASAEHATADPEPPPHPAAAAPALAEGFGAFRSAPARRRRAATRLFVPMMLTYAAVGGTAAALIIYFMQR